jgi:hypothetical protein
MRGPTAREISTEPLAATSFELCQGFFWRACMRLHHSPHRVLQLLAHCAALAQSPGRSPALASRQRDAIESFSIAAPLLRQPVRCNAGRARDILWGRRTSLRSTNRSAACPQRSSATFGESAGAPRATLHQPLTAMRLTCRRACAVLGKVTVSTPFLNAALTLSSSISSTGMRRSKRP